MRGQRRGIDIVSRDLLPRIASSVVLMRHRRGRGLVWRVIAAVAGRRPSRPIVHRRVGGDHRRRRAARRCVFTAGYRRWRCSRAASVTAPSAFGIAAARRVVAAALSVRVAWRPLGVLYALVLGLSLLVLRDSGRLRPCRRSSILVRGRCATDIGAFFAGRADRRPEALAARFAEEDVGRARSAASPRASSPAAGRRSPTRPAICAGLLASSSSFRLQPVRRPVRVVRQAPLRRQGFRPPRPRPRRPAWTGSTVLCSRARSRSLIGIGHSGVGNPAQGLVAW